LISHAYICSFYIFCYLLISFAIMKRGVPSGSGVVKATPPPPRAAHFDAKVLYFVGGKLPPAPQEPQEPQEQIERTIVLSFAGGILPPAPAAPKAPEIREIVPIGTPVGWNQMIPQGLPPGLTTGRGRPPALQIVPPRSLQ